MVLVWAASISLVRHDSRVAYFNIEQGKIASLPRQRQLFNFPDHSTPG